MTKKSKQSKRATKHSKRIKVAAEPEDEVDTATTFSRAETPESISVSPQTEEAGGPVESQQAEPTVAPATKAETAPRPTRSDAAKANIKEGLRLHQIAGRPTKADREIRHYTRNISGCSSQRCSCCTLGPSRQAYCGETKRESVKPYSRLAL